jgi:hypothetical protein
MIASRAGVSMNVKSLRHYTATQLLSGGIDLRNTAARLGHGDGGATTLKHYADPISEVEPPCRHVPFGPDRGSALGSAKATNRGVIARSSSLF